MIDEEKKEEVKEEVNEIPEDGAESTKVEAETESEITDGDTLTPSDDSEEEGEEEIVSEDGEEEIVEDTEEIPDGSDIEIESAAPAEKAVEQSEKMLTQSQVNELVGRVRQETRERVMAEMLERYGVSNDVELNEIFGKGQTYDDLDMEYQNQGNAYKSVMAENALLKSHIDPARWEDVKLILGGKGLEVNAENIEGMIATHPEWRGAVNTETGNKMLGAEELTDMASKKVIGIEKPATLNKLGAESSPVETETDAEKARRLFGY